MKIAGFETHPAADLFPLLSSTALEEFAADVKARGLLQPITLLDGLILDGRNRALACERAGIKPRFEEWSGTGSPIAWVLSVNLHRRHLDESQRAIVGARAMELFAADARARMLAGGPSANLRQGKSAQQAAALVNVSPRSVESASRILRDGAPELTHAVESGKVAVSTAATLALAPREEQRQIVALSDKEILARAKEIRAARTEERRQERVETLVKISRGNAPLASQPSHFPVIYADPPWRYEHAESESRAIENQYPTMDLDAICALPVANLATPDALLFMWATSPKLEEAMRVVREWGFVYRTCMVWDKVKIGMGYYARQQHELLLICTRGAPPTPPPSARPGSVLTIERGEHSAKPVEFYEMIERMYPALPKIELFCRSPRAGWAVWGNQSTVAA